MTKYFFVIFTPVFLLLLLIAYSIYQFDSKAELELRLQKNSNIVELQKAMITSDFDMVVSDLLYLAGDIELQEALGNTDAEGWQLVTQNYQLFANKKRIYDQIRFIDLSGKERIRINFNDEDSHIVREEKLQYKQDRYYFIDSIQLQKEEVYVSPFDLNMEHGQVETPIKPVIRFATPVFDANNKKSGILIFNYLGENLIQNFTRAHALQPELSHLLNGDGYWLHGNKREQEWGFMFADKQAVSFAHQYPNEWSHIKPAKRGHFETSNGIFTFDSIFPLHESWKSSTGSSQQALSSPFNTTHDTYSWKIVAFTSSEAIALLKQDTANKTLKWISILILLLTISSLLLARSIHKRQLAELRFKKADIRKAAIHKVAPDSIITIDHQGFILEFNEAAELTFGYSRNDIIGKSLANTIIPERLRASHNHGLKRMRLNHETHIIGRRIETHAINVKGEEFPIELTVTRIPMEEPPIFTGFIRDISERKSAEADIRMLSQALEQTGEAVIITDLLGTIEYVNPSFTQITGYEKEEVLGKNPSLLSSGNQDTSFYQEMWATISKGETWQNRIVDRKKSGEFYPALLTVSPITSEEGEITHYIGLQQNLTEYENLEEKFHQSQKMEAIGTLVGGIAHDFNNTLAGITGNLYLAKMETAELPNVINKLEGIEKLAFRASDMIQQLLTFSRRSMVQKQTIAMPAFVKELIKLHRVSVPESIEFTESIQDESMLIHGDANQLQQVMMNLINNARDAVEVVSNPSIKVKLERYRIDNEFLNHHPDADHAEYAHISVTDNGCGIALENIEHIFEPFFTTKEVGKGTGLGLAMVYGAIHTHDGIIAVNSSKDEGTSFDVYLPLLEIVGEEKSHQQAKEICMGHGETILLVDDDQTVLDTDQEVLEGLGYKVVTASDGQQAVEIYQQHQQIIDLLILDVVMPKLSGVDALKQIRTINPDVSALFATGYDKTHMTDHQHDLNAETVLSKPFSITELSMLIRNKLAR